MGHEVGAPPRVHLLMCNNKGKHLQHDGIFSRWYSNNCQPMLESRKNLVFQMMMNQFAESAQPGDQASVNAETSSKVKEDDPRLSGGVFSSRTYHHLMTPPPLKGKWLSNHWRQVATQYMLQQCCLCKQRTRTYCACNKYNLYYKYFVKSMVESNDTKN